MKSRGVIPAAVCPRCRRVFSEVARCPDDGTPLDSSRLLPAVVRDRYRLLSVLGEGGMGTVFLAEDLRLPREVAIKIVRLDLNADPGIRLRFVREANTLARLSHPGRHGAVRCRRAGRRLALPRHGAPARQGPRKPPGQRGGTPAQVGESLARPGRHWRRRIGPGSCTAT